MEYYCFQIKKGLFLEQLGNGNNRRQRVFYILLILLILFISYLQVIAVTLVRG